MPEILWRAYIDFEIAEAEFDHARALYARLLQRSGHVKLWIAYALFELEYAVSGSAEEEQQQAPTGGNIVAAREIFLKGYETLKRQGLKEERLLLLESWRDAEHAALQTLEGMLDCML